MRVGYKTATAFRLLDSSDPENPTVLSAAMTPDQSFRVVMSHLQIKPCSRALLTA